MQIQLKLISLNSHNLPGRPTLPLLSRPGGWGSKWLWDLFWVIQYHLAQALKCEVSANAFVCTLWFISLYSSKFLWASVCPNQVMCLSGTQLGVTSETPKKLCKPSYCHLLDSEKIAWGFCSEKRFAGISVQESDSGTLEADAWNPPLPLPRDWEFSGLGRFGAFCCVGLERPLLSMKRMTGWQKPPWALPGLYLLQVFFLRCGQKRSSTESNFTRWCDWA